MLLCVVSFGDEMKSTFLKLDAYTLTVVFQFGRHDVNH